jgi:hypothetical protein
MRGEPTSLPNTKRVTVDWSKARKGSEAYVRAGNDSVRIHHDAELQQRRDIGFRNTNRAVLGPPIGCLSFIQLNYTYYIKRSNF